MPRATKNSKQGKTTQAKKDTSMMWSELAGKYITGYYNEEYDNLSTSVGVKNKKGDYENVYVSIFTSKEKFNWDDVEIDDDNKFKLQIKSGWFTAFKGKLAIFINELHSIDDSDDLPV